mmetsp:Transcript_724/g.1536  ORF Transcript_724/g.1536 Transcript_724/m.1536 type:complete len:228 (+) Transcript_724:1731-2414(+)
MCSSFLDQGVCEQSLSASGWTVQQNTLRCGHACRSPKFGESQRHFNQFSHKCGCLIESTDGIVSSSNQWARSATTDNGDCLSGQLSSYGSFLFLSSLFVRFFRFGALDHHIGHNKFKFSAILVFQKQNLSQFQQTSRFFKVWPNKSCVDIIIRDRIASLHCFQGRQRIFDGRKSHRLNHWGGISVDQSQFSTAGVFRRSFICQGDDLDFVALSKSEVLGKVFGDNAS